MRSRRCSSYFTKTWSEFIQMNPQKQTPLEEAVAVLTNAGIVDDEHLRDALWLAQFLPEYPLDEPTADEPLDESAADQPPRGRKETGRGTSAVSPPAGEWSGPTEAPPTKQDSLTKLFAQMQSAGAAGTVRAAPVYVPASGALPHPLELSRALRPFGRRVPGRQMVLDERLTVEKSAAASTRRPAITPAFRRAPERWFSVALVFDDAAGMAPWRRTAEELQRLLGGLGLFRDVRLWLLSPALQLRSATGSLASPRQLNDPSGRTIVLMLTNGVGAHWRSRGLIELLDGWSQSGPAVICSLLPPKRWPHTDLGSASLWVRAPLPGTRNALLRAGEGRRPVRFEPGATPYPVFPLEREGVARWAGMQMSRRREWVSALLLSPEWFEEEPENDAEGHVNVPRRVAEFAAMASPEAMDLLRFLSAVPLNLPIMRLVQARMLPRSSLSAMSEVLMSGLIRPVNPEEVTDDPERAQFEFVEGAREELRGVTGIRELERIVLAVRDTIRGFIEAEAGFAIHDFEAWVLDPSGEGELPKGVHHFAEVMSGTLSALGYADLGQRRATTAPSEKLREARHTVFISYSHKDKKWLEEFLPFLKVYEREMKMDIWMDTRIANSTSWMNEIQSALETAKVAVLLVTAHYLASDFIAHAEVSPILAAEREKGLSIVWVAVAASAYGVTPIRNYPCANEPSRPLDTMTRSRRARIWSEVATDVFKAFQADGAQPADAEEPDFEDPVEGRVLLLYRRGCEPDQTLLKYLENELKIKGYPIFIDRHVQGGMRWAGAISKHIENASAVIPLLSARSVQSEMLGYEIEIAHGAGQRRKGKPHILPIRVGFKDALHDPFDLLDPISHISWDTPDDNQRLLEEIVQFLESPPEEPPPYRRPFGGAITPDDPMYVTREEDQEFHRSLVRKASVVLIKGARQIGKTSLIASGLRDARTFGYRTVYTDFQKLNQTELSSLDSFYRSLAESISEELNLDLDVEEEWKPKKAPNQNFERIVRRHILRHLGTHLVWAMDEVDRVFSFPFSAEFFSLVRAWHNARAISVDSPWEHLTMAIAYSTEAHLFITDQNQSPFNIGISLELKDFTLDQVDKLNEKHGAPLLDWKQVTKFHELLGGQPYLTRRGLYELAEHGTNLDTLVERAASDGGPFGDHLRRLLVNLARNPDLADAVRLMLQKQRGLSESQLYRLRRAGIALGSSPESARLRCRVYEDYFQRRLLDWTK